MQNSYGNIISEEYIAKGKIYIIDKECWSPNKILWSFVNIHRGWFFKNFEVIFDEGFKNIYLKKHEDFKTDVDIKWILVFQLKNSTIILEFQMSIKTVWQIKVD